MPCNPNQSIFSPIFSQSQHQKRYLNSTTKPLVVKRENGSSFVIKESSLNGSNSQEWNQLAKTLLTCWFVLQTLQESDLKEALKELEEIVDFYRDRAEFYSLESKTSSPQSSKLKGKVKSIQVRPPLVFDW